MPDFEQSYIHQLLQIRQQTGMDYQFLLPCVRAVIRDEEGRILFVRRNIDESRFPSPPQKGFPCTTAILTIPPANT